MVDVISILSGGVDSTTLLYYVRHVFGKNIEAVTFDYGQKHKKEIECAREICRRLKVKHTIIDISGLKNVFKGSALTDEIEVPEGYYTDKSMRITVVPNRNMVFIAIAAAYAVSKRAKKVAIGVHKGDHAIYPDCRPEFIEALNSALDFGNYEEIQVYAPFINNTKREIIAIGVSLGVDYSLTWTCYKGGEAACGKCGACVERLESFEALKIKDPIDYLAEGIKK